MDCIDIYKQPAFNHPALRNHIIQIAPSSVMTMKPEAAITKEKCSMIHTHQLWRKNGSCPIGTIPVRRNCQTDVLDCNLAAKYGRKNRPSIQYELKTSNYLQANHAFAIMMTEGFNYHGAKADIKVWNPYVEHDDEYSTSRIILENGAYNNYECVESGWMVNPSVYGDRETRIYAYWTVDGSSTTGCFDLMCPGFVQTSNEIALGGVIKSIPVPGGLPWIMTLHIVRDPISKNWWLRYQGNISIGYWPAELFKALRSTVEVIQWGGEIYSTRLGHPGHTKTEMGSGDLPLVIQPNSTGWFKRMRIQENSMDLKQPESAYTYSDDHRCYPIYLRKDQYAEPEFYYGGPGKDWHSLLCAY
ncbi:uncharacterized protein LOC130798800 [Amaranthus tricolor]|uniref:uncharacterized protein LOC130798800 n=1 Tax=Amaranthus tricolor TaxID=29722 RepID=UPI00258D94B3|nr:uncharacterized protein LOC130798800 [Amaranthus tricolor]